MSDHVDVVYNWAESLEQPHRSGIFSPDGSMIASAVGDSIVFWDAITGRKLKEYSSAHNGDIKRLNYSPDGKHVVSVSQDCLVKLWRAQKSKKKKYKSKSGWNGFQPLDQPVSSSDHEAAV